MPDGKTLRKAIALAEGKYADNGSVKTILASFRHSRSMVDHAVTGDHDIFESYVKGLHGISGYGASYVDPASLNLAFSAQMNRLQYIAQAQAKAECLILLLQSLGEALDY